MTGDASSGLPSKAMILAAGSGRRLRPLTENLPKCMVPVNGRPLLEHTIEWLRQYGVDDLVINLCHLPDAVMNHFGDGSHWGVCITYSVEVTPLGTAGGVRNASWFFDGPFLVWYGDNLSKCQLDRLWLFHQGKGGVATIAVHARDDPTTSGMAELDNQDRILHFVEKPQTHQVFSHWVSAGIFVLEPDVVAAIPQQGAPDFGLDVFPALLAEGTALYGYRMSESEGLWWIDRPEDLKSVQHAWTRGVMQ